MKKAFSLLWLFIISCAMFLTTSSTSFVSAKEEDVEKKEYVVYKLSLEKDSNYYAQFNVSQYYRKTNLDEYGATSSYTNIYSKTKDASLAMLQITNNGDVLLSRSHDVEITNLKFYYAIANQAEGERLFCNKSSSTNYELCDNSLSISENEFGMSNWKNAGNSTVLEYTTSEIETQFKVSEADLNSNDIPQTYYYKGYNIFDHMPLAIKTIVKNTGVYIVAGMSVKYNDRIYVLNHYVIENPSFRFSKTTNAGDGSVNTSLKLNMNDVGSTIFQTVTHENTTDLVKLAALIAPEIKNVKQTQSMAKLEEFWNVTLRPIMMIAIGILFVVVGSYTGVTIVKSSDEPEVRSAAIKRLVGMFIGMAIIEVVLIFYPKIVDIIRSIIG